MKVEESHFKEISNKSIIDLKYSFDHTIARTIDGNVYCWGSNLYGGIGNGRREDKIYKPVLNGCLIEKNITEIDCGAYHSLALTFEGEVYSWGWDSHYSEIILNNENIFLNKIQLKPSYLNKFNEERIKSISCGHSHSLALTQSGIVYSWGNNWSNQLGRDTVEESDSISPEQIKVEIKIDKICCGHSHSLLLSYDKDIYVFGSNENGELGIQTESDKQLSPIKLNINQKFNDIATLYNYRFSCALTINGIYYIWGDCGHYGFIKEPKETSFKSFNQIFSLCFEISYKSVKGGLIEFKDDNFLNTGFFSENFININKIGKGGYGKVYTAQEKSNKASFAVKMMKFNLHEKINPHYNETILKEFENFTVIKSLCHENLVKYFALWFENIGPFRISSFTQMELCDKDFMDLIREMKINKILVEYNTLTVSGYYISSQLFIQVLEGVNYLHTRSPPIIHRDLTPYNILIKIIGKKIIVKIADFGIACLHKYDGHQHTEDRGHPDYIAPEVKAGSDYDTRADIYSLGIVMLKLFLIDIKRDYEKSKDYSKLMNKYYNLRKICRNMIQIFVSERLESCQLIIIEKNSWVLSDKEVNIKEELTEYCDNCGDEEKKSYVFKIIEQFFKNFPRYNCVLHK